MVITIGSMFSGAAGFEQGFDAAGGFETKWQIEIDKYCTSLLEVRYPLIKHFGDIREVDATKLEPVDIVVFGSPCQDFSAGGGQQGFNGYRSNLFEIAIYKIRQLPKPPQLILWENVPGILRSNDGTDFATCLRMLANTGALDIGWRILDAKGVGKCTMHGGALPQSRRRIFVVADLAGRRSAEILDIRRSEKKYIKPSDESTRIRTKRNDGEIRLVFRKSHDAILRRGDTWEYAYHTNTLTRINTGWVRQTTLAIDTDNEHLRVLTPIEWERLQGWQDNWTQHEFNGKPFSEVRRWEMVGNGVNSIVVQWLANRIKSVM